MRRCEDCGVEIINEGECRNCFSMDIHPSNPKPNLSDTEKVLEERGNRYGEFSKHARIAQTMKAALWEGCKNSGKEDHEIPDFIWESMDMICHKLARVVNGDCLYDDNFVDIAGYAELVVKELEKD